MEDTMIKKLILSLLLITCIYAQTAVVPTIGDGTEANPYQIGIPAIAVFKDRKEIKRFVGLQTANVLQVEFLS